MELSRSGLLLRCAALRSTILGNEDCCVQSLLYGAQLQHALALHPVHSRCTMLRVSQSDTFFRRCFSQARFTCHTHRKTFVPAKPLHARSKYNQKGKSSQDLRLSTDCLLGGCKMCACHNLLL